MSQRLPWRHHRINPEGLLETFETPGPSRRRKLGALAVAGASMLGLALQADVIHSEMTTPNIAPRTVLAKDSIACQDAKAIVFVYSGYGIQNGELTAAKITSIANDKNMCTRWVDNGTDIDVNQVAEIEAIDARENDVDTIIHVGESVGGVEAALVENRIIETHGDEFSFPGMLMDSSPDGAATIKWGNPTLAEQVAEHCRLLRLGDVTMTAFSLLTDQNEERRTHFWQYWDRVYEATRSSSMRLRTAQACLASQGIPDINEAAQTWVFYGRNQDPYGDPIVDVEKAEASIRPKTHGLFLPVYMKGDGITHAAPWDAWSSYQPYYQQVFDKIDQVMTTRYLNAHYRRSPHIPQPR